MRRQYKELSGLYYAPGYRANFWCTGGYWYFRWCPRTINNAKRTYKLQCRDGSKTIWSIDTEFPASIPFILWRWCSRKFRIWFWSFQHGWSYVDYPEYHIQTVLASSSCNLRWILYFIPYKIQNQKWFLRSNVHKLLSPSVDMSALVPYVMFNLSNNDIVINCKLQSIHAIIICSIASSSKTPMKTCARVRFIRNLAHFR